MTRLAVAIVAILALEGCAAQMSGHAPVTARANASVSAPAQAPAAPQEEAVLYLNVVDGLVRQQRYGAALAFLDGYAMKRQDLEPRYWFLRGNALLGLSRQDDAFAAFTKLEGTSLAAEGWNGRGRVEAARSQWRDAAANFKTATEAEPANPDFLNNLAFTSMHFGQCDASAAYLRQAYELKPDSSLIRNNLIIALTLSGEQDDADKIIGGVKDEAQRAQIRATIDGAIKDNHFTADGKS